MVENRIFSYPLAFNVPVRDPSRNIVIPFGTERIEWCDYPMVKRFDDTFSRFDRIPACDGQADGQIDRQSCDGIVRATA